MNWHEYQLATYQNEDIEPILSLVSSMWGNNVLRNRDYFFWKHRNNPFLKGNMGIVARHEGKVIGFLGYVPAEYQMNENRFLILQQSDTVIHSEHRRKGLFSAMSKTGIRMYGGEYKYIVNFTSNLMTAAGLYKLGWQPLTPVRYLRRWSYLNYVKNILTANKFAINPGTYGNIEVSDKIRLSSIFGVSLNSSDAENKICLNKTLDFLNWRLSNPRYRFIYLYYLIGEDVAAYMVVRVRNNHAHIFDYGQKPGVPGTNNFLDFLIRNTGLSSISFFDSSTPNEIKPFLSSNRFRGISRIEKIMRNQTYEIPIIIRPAIEKYAEDNWYIGGGIDVRDINNWHITEMCFD
jgi:hypothetical protein